MPKIHKAWPSGSKTRPVDSSCGCLNRPISERLNEVLLPLAVKQKLYVKNSYEFKRNLERVKLDQGCSIFTYDAVELYPRIPTDKCIQRISNWLSQQKHFYRRSWSHHRSSSYCPKKQHVRRPSDLQEIYKKTFQKGGTNRATASNMQPHEKARADLHLRAFRLRTATEPLHRWQVDKLQICSIYNSALFKWQKKVPLSFILEKIRTFAPPQRD